MKWLCSFEFTLKWKLIITWFFIVVRYMKTHKIVIITEAQFKNQLKENLAYISYLSELIDDAYVRSVNIEVLKKFTALFQKLALEIYL